MAATKTQSGDINARTQDKIRASIKVFEIVKALQDHILAGLKLTNTQVRSAEVLLRKISPDLLATAISDSRETGLPLLQIVRNTPAESATHPLDSKVKPEPDPAADPASADQAA